MAFNFTICVECGNGNVENTSLMLCASCAHARRKADRTKVKVVKPVKKVTEKRSKQNQDYARLRDQYLEAYPACEVVECNNRSNQIHHINGREGDKLTDTNFFLAVCPDCHTKIHANPKWAQDNNYMILRTLSDSNKL